jgi:uncharacterized phage-like protein YoqJ
LGGYSDTNPVKLNVQKAIRAKLLELNPELCISGMALGVDQWAAEICIELCCPFEAAIPCLGQENIWPPGARQHYRDLLAKAQRIHYVSEGGYTMEAMRKRNEYMVDACDILLAVYKESSGGGTGLAIKYAKKCGKPVHIIDPYEVY